MEVTITEQIFEQIKKATKILIVLPEALTADSLASGLAFRLFLNKQQKDVNIISSGAVPENLMFLPGADQLKNNVASGKSMVVTLDTSVKKLEEISYQTSDDKVHIFLKAQGQEFEPSDLTFSKDKFPVDLIIALEAKSLEDFGKFYEHQADLFYETPKINIDNKSGNEYFGTINVVDVTATSVAEILAELFQQYEEQLVDQDMATCLLTGIISKTHSFQHVHTTPKSFLKASELVALGGRQQEIIKHIYKTKSLTLLKLWGRALARMKTEEGIKTVYSSLGYTDFEKAEATEADSISVLREFVDNINGYQVIALFTEPVKGSVSFCAAIHEQVFSDKILQDLQVGRVANFNFGNYRILEADNLQLSLAEIETKFLEVIKKDRSQI